MNLIPNPPLSQIRPQERTWRVAVLGLGPHGLYDLECLLLRPAIQLVGACDPNPQRRSLAGGLDCPIDHDWRPLLEPGDIDAVFLDLDEALEPAIAALHSGSHVVINRPWRFTDTELSRINDSAIGHQRIATYASRRWRPDFLPVWTAVRSERLGAPRSIRYSSCLMQVADPFGTADVLQTFGFDLLDQLFALHPARPITVYARHSLTDSMSSPSGFFVDIEFPNHCRAQIDVELRSRLGYRSGWMIEGMVGSYRSGRIYAETADGEITDEPISALPNPTDQFLDRLVSAWQEPTLALPTLKEAASIVQLIEAIRQSALTGEVIRL